MCAAAGLSAQLRPPPMRNTHHDEVATAVAVFGDKENNKKTYRKVSQRDSETVSETVRRERARRHREQAFASASAVRRRYSHGHSTARAQPASDRPSAAASALPACKLRRCRITCCCPAFRLTHAHQVRSVRFLVRSWFHYFFSVVLCMLGTRVCQSVSFLSVCLRLLASAPSG